MTTQIRSWFFTYNNYTEEDVRALKCCPATYIIFGKEKAPTTGTPHLQGAFYWRTTYNAIRKRFKNIWVEPMKGNWDQAAEYCCKDGDVYERGTRPRQGHRKDLDEVRNVALDGGLREVTARFDMMQIRVAQNFLTYNEPGRDWKPEVIWLWGRAGVGKSRRARKLLVGDVYTKSDGTKWWDGYDGHESVIIDDFRCSWWKMSYMLGLIDRYEFRVEVKGGYRQMRAKKMVITCPMHPRECYKFEGEENAQLLRRIDQIVEVEGGEQAD